MDQLTIDLSSGIKAKRALNVLVFQISVNGLGAANNLYASVVGGIQKMYCWALRMVPADSLRMII